MLLVQGVIYFDFLKLIILIYIIYILYYIIYLIYLYKNMDSSNVYQTQKHTKSFE